MRPRLFASAALVALLLVGCTAPAPSPDAPKTATEAAPTPAAPAPAATAPIATPAPQAPQQAPEAPTEHKVATDASAPSRSCRTDSDCAVKNVGSCCGAFPMCVNKDAKTDPAAVQAQCAKAGVASVCGFQEVSGCQCVKGQCENLTSGAAVM